MERNYQDTHACVAVIGGGLAGLAAAAYLARSGRNVTLFERATSIGGRAASQEHEGSIFNLGAHAIYDQAPIAQVLRELGVAYSGGNPAGIRCIKGGKSYLAPVDPVTLLRTELLDPAEKWEAARLLLKLQLADPVGMAGISVAEWLDREVRRPAVRNLLEANARVASYTNAPERVSMGLFVDLLQQITKGKIVYVDGGWQTLVDGLANAAREAGARLVTGARVEEVLYDANGATGLRMSDGSLYEADAVVIAVSPRDALKLLHGEAGAALQAISANTVPMEAACLDVALSSLPNPQNRVAISMDSPLFLTVQSEFSKVTTGGRALLYTLKYLVPGAPVDAEANERELEEWLDLTQRGWRDLVVERRYMPHLTVSNALVSASRGGMPGRPSPQVLGVRNLYIAGDWVGPTGALSSAGLWSAKLAANAILSAQATYPERKAA